MNPRLTLDVRLDGFADPVGTLSVSDHGATQFAYHRAFVRTGQAISLSLPLQEEPFDDATSRAFFDNLLPENDQVQQVMDRERLQRTDIVDLLAHVGADCAGALSCLPLGSPAIKVPGNLATDYQAFSDQELATLIERLANREGLPNDIRDRSPVAGVQSKIAVTVLPDGSIGIPRPDVRVPTTHILKVPRRQEAEEARLEEASGKLAQACGLPTCQSQAIEVAGHEALLITRFDRQVRDGIVNRIHQEDFAQALGLPASLKYERRGRPGFCFDAAAAQRVLDQLDDPAEAVERFLLITFFNLAIGNNDNHAKNHAILHLQDERPILAPYYDLLPIRLNDRYTDELAFRIGNADRFDVMTPTDIAQFLATFGFDSSESRQFVDGSLAHFLRLIEQTSPSLRAAGLLRFDNLVGQEMGRLADLLGLDLDVRERDLFVEGTAGGWPAS